MVRVPVPGACIVSLEHRSLASFYLMRHVVVPDPTDTWPRPQVLLTLVHLSIPALSAVRQNGLLVCGLDAVAHILRWRYMFVSWHPYFIPIAGLSCLYSLRIRFLLPSRASCILDPAIARLFYPPSPSPSSSASPASPALIPRTLFWRQPSFFLFFFSWTDWREPLLDVPPGIEGRPALGDL